MRIGHGYDLHRLQPGGTLMLGGVAVAEDLSPVAHSDGDVVIHALVDALLGAMGWGDIGEMFPEYRSAVEKRRRAGCFWITFMERCEPKDLRLVNADVTILAERPKLKPLKPQCGSSSPIASAARSMSRPGPTKRAMRSAAAKPSPLMPGRACSGKGG